MSITLDINEELMKKAADFTGVHDTRQLMNDALVALIEKRAYKLGMELGGSDPTARLRPEDQPLT